MAGTRDAGSFQTLPRGSLYKGRPRGRPFSPRPGRAEAGFIGVFEGDARLGCKARAALCLTGLHCAVSFGPFLRKKRVSRGVHDRGFHISGPGQPGRRHGQGPGRRLSRRRAPCSRRWIPRSGEKLSAILWDGPIEKLTLTENTQPGLMAVSIAVIRVLEAEAGLDLKRDAKFVAGHSLGEYSALAAAGAIYGERRGAASAHARALDAEGGSGRRRRDGGFARIVVRRRRRGRERRRAGTSVPGGQ